MRVHTISILILFFFGCVSDKKATTEVAGVYTTYKPNYIEQVFIERRYNAGVYPLPAVMMYLRADGTYVFGFCDNQISEAGKYSLTGDSILLHDRYNLDERMEAKSLYVYSEKKKDLLYVITREENLDGKTTSRIIPLKRNNTSVHLGFLRGQDMELDSLIHFYKQRSVEEQNVWTDSVLQSLNGSK